MNWAAAKRFTFFGMLVLPLSTSFFSRAAESSGAPQEFRQHIWTKDDGLPDNTIRAIFQTRDGYLWIGTETGLARFDGVRFTSFRHPAFDRAPAFAGTDVIAEDADGVLWLGTFKGLLRYFDGNYTHFTKRDGLWADYIYSLCIGNSNVVWVGTEAGLNRIRHGRIEKLDIQEGAWPATIGPVFPDKSDYLWLLSPWMVHRRNIRTWKVDSVFGPDGTWRPTGFHIDPKGTVWLGSNDGLFQVETNRLIQRFPKVNDSIGGHSTWILTDQGGSLWFNVGISGVRRLSNGEFSAFDSSSGLPDNWIMSGYEDREGNLWLGTYEAGIVQWQPRHLLTVARQEGLPHDEVRAVCESRDGSVWIGSDGGLSQIQFTRSKPTFTNYSTNNGLSINTVRSLCEDHQGRVWVGTEFGLDCFENGTFRPYSVPGEKEKWECAVRVICEDSSGNLWFGSKWGLHRLREGQRKTFQMADGLSTNEVRVILESSSGALWAGTLGGGLNRLSFESANDVPKVTIYNTTQGLSNDFITALHEETDGTLWIGTRSGLNRLKNGRIAALGSDDGLVDGWINSILDDDLGNFWMSGEQGIFHVTKEDLQRCAESRLKSVRCVLYNESEGMATRKTNGAKSQPAACKTRDGRFWFATPKGVVIVDPKKVLPSEVAPGVVVEQIQTNGKLIFDNAAGQIESKRKTESSTAAKQHTANPKAQIANLKPKITFAPGSAQVLEIHYAANTFVAPEKTRFRYRVHGFETNWVEAGTSHVARYTDLAPGDYRFEVTACDHRGIWNESGASFAFYVAPRFWQVRWFQPVCWLSALFLFGGVIVHLRHVQTLREANLRHLHSLQEAKAIMDERSRIARDLHDDLGAGLTRIRLLSQGFGFDPLAAAPDTATRISEDAADMIGKLDDVLWITNPEFDSLDSLVAHLREHAARFLADSNLTARLDFPSQVPAQRVLAGLRRDIFLVLKETLNNILKHAGATEVYVQLRLVFAADANSSSSPESLELSVIDNGGGFDPSMPSPITRPVGGNGLTNMRVRMKSLGGDFEIESAPGQGTRVIARAPLNS